MLLTIDAGNTNIVFAVHDGQEFKHIWRCKTEAGKTADEYTAFLFPHFTREGLFFQHVKETVICSVVPDANEALVGFCKQNFGHVPLLVDHEVVAPYLPVKLKAPHEIGADRLVNGLAAAKLYQTPAVVIDFGTATTFDVIDAKGQYAGGMIAPGVNLSMSALHAAAAKLPVVDIRKPEKVIGDDTVSAMQSGLFWGYVGLVEGIMARLGSHLPQKPCVIATGGLAGLFATELKIIDEVDPDLTLRGLLYISQAYKEQTKAA